jgi:hypothetical protein
MKHELTKKVKRIAHNRRKPGKAAVAIVSDNSQHLRKPRTGKTAPIAFEQSPIWNIEKDCDIAPIGEGATAVSKLLKLLELKDYQQPLGMSKRTSKGIIELDNLSKPTFTPIENELGNSPDLALIEGKLQSTERMSNKFWNREFLSDKDSNQ